MRHRVVIPEILDHLPADDPEAMRSRRDLSRINFLMGNERWIRREVRRFPAAARRGMVEIGAGDGALCHRLAQDFPDAPVSAYDLAPRPAGAGRVDWHQGDLFKMPPPAPGGVLVANLFLHHFEAPALVRLGKWMEGFERLIFNEPDRAQLPHVLGCALDPFVNRVTRHDMQVSIDAGFRKGELTDALGLLDNRWHIRETSTWRGSRRVVASRS
ncbi:MAG: class I SAM-dependent methyltransferase [Verrucomicrobiota bacterium]